MPVLTLTHLPFVSNLFLSMHVTEFFIVPVQEIYYHIFLCLCVQAEHMQLSVNSFQLQLRLSHNTVVKTFFKDHLENKHVSYLHRTYQ